MPNTKDNRGFDVERILKLGNIAIWHVRSPTGLFVEVLAMDNDCLAPLLDDEGKHRMLGSGPTVGDAILTALANNLDKD